jgi:hypothetical protein
MKLVFVLLTGLFLSIQASAKQIITGDEAKVSYEELVKLQVESPNDYVSYTHAFFGDDRHPELGRVWLTTIFRHGDVSTICYEYDYRESNAKDYLCELNAN